MFKNKKPKEHIKENKEEKTEEMTNEKNTETNETETSSGSVVKFEGLKNVLV